MVKPIIFQVVGYQNSGKTTLTSKLIEKLSTNRLTTVTIKHHGHGGKPDAAEKKDTTKHLSAGAIATLVEGDGRLILQAEPCAYSLKEQIELMHYFQTDVILVEGYKQENYPKLVLMKEKQDLTLLDIVNNVQAVVFWEAEMMDIISAKLDVPIFHIDDEAVISWTVQQIKNFVNEIGHKC
ncbi:molybdopterin-guanine dinucleotide biosynthesis protein B [Bacillus sp. S3]|uniref:molybdopterin-guanine dinucleotide biosynthesis protein B n=1 Tax=Bacillus sp. S3 TaxID=486398 RepID=UPI001CC1E791|nr:molybdopterin-guanine dinucleotide biosynthesis protein B [Bacillus sp. S3]